jgi:ABC-2 type transport system ATP-binding protein
MCGPFIIKARLMSAHSALDVKNCSMIYESGAQALSNISLSVKPGDFFALLGPNGAGKTTLINIIRTLVKKTSGKITLLGHDLDEDPFLIKSIIGCVPQEFNFNVFATVENVLIYNAGYQGITHSEAKTKAAEVMEKLHLSDKAKQTIRTLSGGMKRRLMIARALMHQPKCLLLDEPTAGVDIETRHDTWALLKQLNEEGMTIMLTTHYLEEAEHLCNQLAIIHRGRIINTQSMHALLNDPTISETILVYVESPLPKNTALPFEYTRLSDQVIEITLNKNIAINTIFQHFKKLEINITRVRSPQSRLESIYRELIHRDNTNNGHTL